MTIIVLCICGYIMGWLFFRPLRDEPTRGIARINDKNWIVNGEFVSLEENTKLLKFKQEMEDGKHYRNYERERLGQDRERISKDWMQTKSAILKFPDLKRCVTEEKLGAITEKYDKYLIMCNKLEEKWY